MLAVLHENQVRAQRLLLFDGGDGEVRAAAGSEYDPDLLPRHRLLHHAGEAVNIVVRFGGRRHAALARPAELFARLLVPAVA